MSQIDIRSPKHCAKKGFKCNFNKKLLKIISTLTFSLLSIILLIYFTLHPSKPQFVLQQLDIDQLDFSSPPHLLNSTIEITLEVRNPNQRVGVYYDELQAYASYKGQQITLNTIIVPSFYQGQQDSNLLSASLNGISMPVSASLRYEVGQDQANGKMIMVIKVNGHVRWKVASWVSGRYMIQVNCVAILSLGLPNLEAPLNSKQGTQCSTTI